MVGLFIEKGLFAVQKALLESLTLLEYFDDSYCYRSNRMP